MKNQNSLKKKSVYTLSFLEITRSICEYGFSSIFTLFLLYVLHFSIPLTSSIYGCYYGLVYLLPLFCGYISDKYLDTYVSIIVGSIFIIISQFILAFTSSLYVPSDVIITTFIFNLQTISYIIGLIFMGLGIGFTVTNMNKLLKVLYNDDMDSYESAYSIFYIAINLGACLGPIIFSLIVGSHPELYSYGFLSCGIILSVGLIISILFKKDLMQKGLHFTDALILLEYLINLKASLLKIFNFIKLHIKKAYAIKIEDTLSIEKYFVKKLSQIEKDRISVILFIFLFLIVYRIAYYQGNISFVFFLDAFVNRTVGSITFPTALFLTLNPLFVLILTPFFDKIWQKCEERNITIGFNLRISIGLLLIALCFFVLTILSLAIDMNIVAKIDIWWVFFYEFILACSELCLLITVYVMIAKLVSTNYFTIIFGLFVTTNALSKFLSGFIAKAFPSNNNTHLLLGFIPINGLCGFFSIFFAVNLIAGIILLIFRKRIERKMHGITI